MELSNNKSKHSKKSNKSKRFNKVKTHSDSRCKQVKWLNYKKIDMIMNQWVQHAKLKPYDTVEYNIINEFTPSPIIVVTTSNPDAMLGKNYVTYGLYEAYLKCQKITEVLVADTRCFIKVK